MGYCCGVGVILTRMLEVQKMMFFATRVCLDGLLGVKIETNLPKLV